MTISAIATHHAWQTGDDAANGNSADQEIASLRDQLSELEPIVSAGYLVATAFRLRDEESLITALRLLTSAVNERDRNDADQS